MTSASQLAQRLGPVHVDVRQTLSVTRSVFRGDVVYVVHDPHSLTNQSLGRDEYRVFCAIQSREPLSTIFSRLVEAGHVTDADEEDFYGFILQLHRAGLLNLPINDAALLHQRFERRLATQRWSAPMRMLFWRVPLWNPDAFLDRTIHWAAPLFTRTAGLIWLALVAAAVVLLIRRHDAAASPLELISLQNLPALWLTLVLLKIVHEFGHAYASKKFGLTVPEMGAFFIMGTPCAYVDATASWTLASKWRRLTICMGGMYFESWAAIAATFVWASTEPGSLNTLCYMVMWLASATTVLFNINPLMRYDGYYILCDLLETPNLRARANERLSSLLKHVLFGIAPKHARPANEPTALLIAFGIAAGVYRAMIMVLLAALLATKSATLGLFAATLMIGGMAYGLLRRLVSFLFWSEESRAARPRVVLVTTGLTAAILWGLVWAPFPATTVVHGVARYADEVVARAPDAGFITATQITPGVFVTATDVVCTVANRETERRVLSAHADAHAAAIRLAALEAQEPSDALQELERLAFLRQRVQRHEQRSRVQDVPSGATGLVLESVQASDVGRFVQLGDPLAIIASGPLQFRCELNAGQLADTQPEIGDIIDVRILGVAGQTFDARIVQVAPAAARDPNQHDAGPQTFVIKAELSGPPPAGLYSGAPIRARLAASSSTLAEMLHRGWLRFIHHLRAA